MKHPYSIFRRKSLRSIVIVLGSMTAAFVVGIETAGDLQPVILPTKADGSVLSGDLTGDGQIDLDDIRSALEIANGYRTPSPKELAADPNRDYKITIDDALAILEQVKRTPQKPHVEL